MSSKRGTQMLFSWRRAFHSVFPRYSTIPQTVKNNNIAVEFTKNSTSVRFLNDDQTYSYSNVFLRDCCNSPSVLDEFSGQKLFTTASIIGVHPDSVEIVENQSIKIKWNDGEQSIISRQFLEKNSSLESRKLGKHFSNDIAIWDGSTKKVDKYPSAEGVDYEAYMQDEETLAKSVFELNKYGLTFINNIPETNVKPGEPGFVKLIGERMAYLKLTFYGEIFDVKSIPNASNIAYTDKFLTLHQDLLYYESPPGIQLLHFIKNRSTGGESVFADGFAAGMHVKTKDPEAYQALLTIPINYHYTKNNHYYYYSHPLLVEDEQHYDDLRYGDSTVFKEVNYAPPFQAPFDRGITESVSNGTLSQDTGAKELCDRYLFKDFLRGLSLFEEFINDPANKLEIRIPEGSCVIFNNRRVLHARNQFDSQSGERWLQGCYLDQDSFQSKLRVLKSKFGSGLNC